MGWEDTIYDTKAVLEDSEPSEVRDLLESYLEGSETQYMEPFKNKWLGVRMYHYVMDTALDDYTDVVGTLQERIETVAKELLDDIKEGDDYYSDCTETQEEMARWFSSGEINLLDTTVEGNIPTITSNPFRPINHRTWVPTKVEAEFTSVPQGYINQDVLTIRVTTKDTATGETKTHEVAHTFEVEALFDEDDFSATFQYHDVDSLNDYDVDTDAVTTKKVGEVGTMRCPLHCPGRFTWTPPVETWTSRASKSVKNRLPTSSNKALEKTKT